MKFNSTVVFLMALGIASAGYAGSYDSGASGGGYDYSAPQQDAGSDLQGHGLELSGASGGGHDLGASAGSDYGGGQDYSGGQHYGGGQELGHELSGGQDLSGGHDLGGGHDFGGGQGFEIGHGAGIDGGSEHHSLPTKTIEHTNPVPVHVVKKIGVPVPHPVGVPVPQVVKVPVPQPYAVHVPVPHPIALRSWFLLLFQNRTKLKLKSITLYILLNHIQFMYQSTNMSTTMSGNIEKNTSN